MWNLDFDDPHLCIQVYYSGEESFLVFMLRARRMHHQTFPHPVYEVCTQWHKNCTNLSSVFTQQSYKQQQVWEWQHPCSLGVPLQDPYRGYTCELWVWICSTRLLLDNLVLAMEIALLHLYWLIPCSLGVPLQVPYSGYAPGVMDMDTPWIRICTTWLWIWRLPAVDMDTHSPMCYVLWICAQYKVCIQLKQYYQLLL